MHSNWREAATENQKLYTVSSVFCGWLACDSPHTCPHSRRRVTRFGISAWTEILAVTSWNTCCGCISLVQGEKKRCILHIFGRLNAQVGESRQVRSYLRLPSVLGISQNMQLWYILALVRFKMLLWTCKWATKRVHPLHHCLALVVCMYIKLSRCVSYPTCASFTQLSFSK